MKPIFPYMDYILIDKIPPIKKRKEDKPRGLLPTFIETWLANPDRVLAIHLGEWASAWRLRQQIRRALASRKISARFSVVTRKEEGGEAWIYLMEKTNSGNK